MEEFPTFISLSDYVPNSLDPFSTRLRREVQKSSLGPSRCILRSDSYDLRFTHIERLVFEARMDFPHLASENIEILIKDMGRRYSTIVGIVFGIEGEIPKHFIEISPFEQILG